MPRTEGHSRVAVVIPCFNEGEAVAEAWCSLADEEPHEAVIVDDGSDDRTTLDVLDHLRAAGAQVLRQENQGLAAARGAGVAATMAPYVLPLDGDDILAPGAISRLADALDADEGAVAAWGDLRIFGGLDRYDPKGSRFDPWLLTYLHDLHASLMLRRGALDSLGGWQRVVFEDWDLSLSIAGRGWRGLYVPGPQIYYRVDDDGMLAGSSRAQGLAELRARHEDVFASRSKFAAGSTVPPATRWALRLIERLPLISEARKHSLNDAVLRRGDPRRRITTPEAGLPAPVENAQRRATALLSVAAAPTAAETKNT